MEGQDAEEQVNRRDPPIEPHLAVTFDSFECLAAQLDALGHRCEHISRALRFDEHVDVHVARASWLEDAVAERDRTTDRVRDACRIQAIVHSKQLVTEFAHARSRISGGYCSSPRPLNGNEPARSRTISRTLAWRSNDASPGAGANSSCRPAPRTIRAIAETDGCRRPRAYALITDRSNPALRARSECLSPVRRPISSMSCAAKPSFVVCTPKILA
jgi:hypothetical protein